MEEHAQVSKSLQSSVNVVIFIIFRMAALNPYTGGSIVMIFRMMNDPITNRLVRSNGGVSMSANT